MKRLAFVLVALAALSASAQELDRHSGFRVIDIYDAALNVTNADRSVTPVRVTERAWSITKGTKVGDVGAGLRIVFLHSGRVIATIDGKPERHKGGDYWAVPDGAALTIEVTSEMAVLRVTSMVAQK